MKADKQKLPNVCVEMLKQAQSADYFLWETLNEEKRKEK